MPNRYLPSSLFSRTLLILVIPTVLVQLVTTYVFYDRHWHTMARRLSGALAGEIALVAQQAQQARGDEERRKLLSQAAQSLHLEFEWQPVEDVSEPLRATRLGRNLVDQIFWQDLQQRLPYEFYFSLREDDERIKVMVKLDSGLLGVYANRKRLFSYTTDLVILWMVGSSILLLGIAAVFLRNQVRPIRKLALAAEKLGKGQEVDDLKPSGALEIRQATVAFRIMRDRIGRTLQQRAEMLAGISHDLRTPLTRLKLQLALLPQTPDIQAMQRDIEEMTQMIEAYLAFARDESEIEETQKVDLIQFLQDCAKPFLQDGKNVDIGEAQEVQFYARPASLKRCVANLLGNACRYGKNVRISAEVTGTNFKLLIDDDGPGIAPEYYEEVFRPFRRLENSRNAMTGGIGLGLSIARNIARGHGGDIILDKSPLGGLRAILTLPR